MRTCARISPVREPGERHYIYSPPGNERLMVWAAPIAMGVPATVRALRAACERPFNPASVR